MDDLLCLVPLRSPGDGKTRLSPSLSRAERAALSGAMLADVVHALRGADVHRIVVAASGDAAAAAASALGCDVHLDPPDVTTLDGALAAAARRHADILDDVLVVQADLPLLAPADIRALLSADAPVVVAPTSDGGTSALLRRPGSVIGTSYGPASARCHIDLAEAAGIRHALVERPGLATDVDTPDDLHGLRSAAVGAATRCVLDHLGEGSQPRRR